jgi:hypothetical protein
MTNLYYLKWPLIVVVVGILIDFFGSMMKVLHWQGSDIVIITATVVTNLGLLFLIIKLALLKKK